ncbi:MAG TPA: hypothetical protein VD772_05740, partial [Anseongella sp.]|nr:hypothetical protein [Anseongella sp.]
RLIFYANNLSPAGEIDAGMTGNALELIPSPAQVEEKKGGLSSSTFSVRFPAGSYNEVRAGKIRPGAAVAFQLTKAIQDTQTGAELDFRLLPKGAYIVQLQGSPAKEGRVVFDEAAMAAGIGGIVDIHKDAWRSPSGPNEYRINFIST